MKSITIIACTIALASCTVTKYNQNPSVPAIELNKDKIIVWQFQHPDWDIGDFNTKKLIEKLKGNDCYSVVEYDSISDICYRNMINFNDSISLGQLVLLAKLTGSRYLLLSEVIDISKKKGILGPFLYEYERDVYYPYPKDEGRWLTYRFQLYDLLNQGKIYNLKVKVSAFKYESETSSGDIWRYYSLSALNLNRIALKKGIRKLNKSLKCK
jgi:hypothetical protein